MRARRVVVQRPGVAAQYIERIELLKGPGAFMFGIRPGGSVGGSINIVTKRVLDVPFVQSNARRPPGRL